MVTHLPLLSVIGHGTCSAGPVFQELYHSRSSHPKDFPYITTYAFLFTSLRMGSTEKELKKKLLDIIKGIGEKKNDGYVYYRKEKLLKEWDACGEGKFTKHGFGKLSTFLKNELSEEELGSDKYRIPQSFLSDIDVNDEERTKPSSVVRGKKPKESPRSIAKPKLDEGGDHGNPMLTLNELKSKVLTMVLQLVKRKCDMHEAGHKCISVKLEELDKEWQKSSQNMKFKDYKFGSFKAFLIEKCQLKNKASENNVFTIDPAVIEAELQCIKSESEISASSKDDEALPIMENPLPSNTSDTSLKINIDHTKQSFQTSYSDQNSATTTIMGASSTDRSHCNEPSAGFPKKLPETRISQSR